MPAGLKKQVAMQQHQNLPRTEGNTTLAAMQYVKLS